MELAEALFLKPKIAQTCTPKAIARQLRQDEFIQTLFNGDITFQRACESHNISRRTGYNWFQKWKKRESLQVDMTWWQLCNKLKALNPEKAFEGLTRLKYRMTPQQMEVKEELKIEEKHVTIIADYTRAVEDAVNRDIEALRTRKQVDTPQAHIETS